MRHQEPFHWLPGWYPRPAILQGKKNDQDVFHPPSSTYLHSLVGILKHIQESRKILANLRLCHSPEWYLPRCSGGSPLQFWSESLLHFWEAPRGCRGVESNSKRHAHYLHFACRIPLSYLVLSSALIFLCVWTECKIHKYDSILVGFKQKQELTLCNIKGTVHCNNSARHCLLSLIQKAILQPFCQRHSVYQ